MGDGEQSTSGQNIQNQNATKNTITMQIDSNRDKNVSFFWGSLLQETLLYNNITEF